METKKENNITFEVSKYPSKFSILGKLTLKKNEKILNAEFLSTPIGEMLVISDENWLYLLEFVEKKKLENEIEKLKKELCVGIVPGKTHIFHSIKEELDQYFNLKLKEFNTPIFLLGTDFQKKVWNELIKIPFGQTRSYQDIAKSIEKPTAFRAVANANGSNQLSIIVPCHRVINTNGLLGGYSGGLIRKKWLLEQENRLFS